MEHITLSQLAGLIKDALSTIERPYWVMAELAAMKVNRNSGHCYLELAEKQGERVVAQMRATAWARPWAKMSRDFQSMAGVELEQGMSVLMCATPTYHELYGLSLNITDIDPRYTLGAIALKRKETLERLQKEGLLDRNRALPMPLVPLRIAVVSAEDAAGYGDFLHRLRANPYGYAFDVRLYPAFMQGARAQGSVLAALGDIAASARHHDVAVVIRGGGSQMDLACFDDYDIAAAIARMPLPVLTGIGHERDETVADRVAHARLITPTAVAQTLVDAVAEFEASVDELASEMATLARMAMKDEGHRLTLMVNQTTALAGAMLERHGQRLTKAAERLPEATLRYARTLRERLSGQLMAMVRLTESSLRGPHVKIEGLTARAGAAAGRLLGRAGDKLTQHERALSQGVPRALTDAAASLERLQTKVTYLDPMHALRRGFSITYHKGVALKDPGIAKSGDVLTTRVEQGEVKSIVKKSGQGDTPADGKQENFLLFPGDRGA